MKNTLIVLLFLPSIFFLSCKEGKIFDKPEVKKSEFKKQAFENKEELGNEAVKSIEEKSTLSNRLEDRIKPPYNYTRTELEESSFGTYLRSLKLKPKGEKVKYYHGGIKSNDNIYVGVVDLEIGDKDLHQCADAVMRLRAEYLWNNKEYDRIHFNFTNGHKVEYSKWMEGNRMKVEGNKTTWFKSTSASNSYENFWDYLELIFMYAGTSSLEKEMQSIKISEAQIGDVLIQGGFPGHAVIIIDEAENRTSGEKMFLLAQSYMPAQELQILVNPMKKSNPWYEIKKGEIQTPEWTFKSSDLRRFTN